ncbi:type II secretion system GspH family protein [Patescibacteria group bacterium]|nr:type II secretion system GspH family protein [Patescibacteria group bacterium]
MTKLIRQRAFTLVELLIVITIIGILAAALLPKVIAGPSNARDVQRKADLQQIATAIESYANDHNGLYPMHVIPSGCVSAIASQLSPYLTNIPKDPKGLQTKNCTGTSGGYVYYQLDGGKSFGLGGVLESSTKTGPNIFDQTTFTFSPFTMTYAEKIADYPLCNGINNCGAGTSITKPMYVIGR